MQFYRCHPKTGKRTGAIRKDGSKLNIPPSPALWPRGQQCQSAISCTPRPSVPCLRPPDAVQQHTGSNMPYPSPTVTWSCHPLPLLHDWRARAPQLSALRPTRDLTWPCLASCQPRKPHVHVGPHYSAPLMFPPCSSAPPHPHIVALAHPPLPSLAPPHRRCPGSPLLPAQQQ